MRGVARAQARQHHRRTAGIDRRRHPGIDAEIRRRHHALPVEGGGDAFDALAAGGKEGRHHQDQRERAQRHRIAQRQLRLRPAGLELARRQQRAFDMRAPERLRHRIVLIGGDLVGDGRGRPVRLAAAAVEPAQAVRFAGQPQQQQRDRGRRGEDEEQDQPDGARQRRQHDPQTGPGQRQEQAERGRQRGQRRPQPLPQQTAARALQRPRQHRPPRLLAMLCCSSKPSKSRSVARASGESTAKPG